MKTKYETPQINVLTLCAGDVIATSATVGGLNSEQSYTPSGGTGGSTGGNIGNWGDLWS